jgi:hypothetical protein
VRDTSMKKRTMDHVYTGLQLGFGLTAGICTMTLLAYGFDKLRVPKVDDSLFTFLKDYPPRLVGGMCVAISVSILVGTVDRWAKMLSGLFSYGVFGGLLAVADGGFHSRIASLQLTRLEAATMTALIGTCAFLTMRLSRGEINLVDRGASLSAPLLLMWAATSNNATTGFKAILGTVVVFAVAAGYDHIVRYRQPKRTQHDS